MVQQIFSYLKSGGYKNFEILLEEKKPFKRIFFTKYIITRFQFVIVK